MVSVVLCFERTISLLSDLVFVKLERSEESDHVEDVMARCGRSVSKLVESVAPKFARLEVCNLRRCPLLTDQAIQALAGHCHDLRVLDLSSGTRLTDASLLALARGCGKLDRLDLSGCVGVTQVGLVALAASCKKLRQLSLCGCDNAGSDTALQVSMCPLCNDGCPYSLGPLDSLHSV